MKMKIQQMPFNAEKASERGFEWFEMIVDDFVKRNKLVKPTKAEIKEVFAKLTGKELAKDADAPEKKVTPSKN